MNIDKKGFSFRLINGINKEVGYLDATLSSSELEITRFWVHIFYRSSKKRYGKMLLDSLIVEAKKKMSAVLL